ncbi:MAG TPA: hypothetical protein VKD90_13645, partial [Gemmataceae bacterium]|nr:hypothetical protein [Gemmataceae bacterium]
ASTTGGQLRGLLLVEPPPAPAGTLSLDMSAAGPSTMREPEFATSYDPGERRRSRLPTVPAYQTGGPFGRASGGGVEVTAGDIRGEHRTSGRVSVGEPEALVVPGPAPDDLVPGA